MTGLFSNGKVDAHRRGEPLDDASLLRAGAMVWLCSGVEIMTPSARVILLYSRRSWKFSSHLRSWLNRGCSSTLRFSAQTARQKCFLQRSWPGNSAFEPTIPTNFIVVVPSSLQVFQSKFFGLFGGEVRAMRLFFVESSQTDGNRQRAGRFDGNFVLRRPSLVSWPVRRDQAEGTRSLA